MQFGIKNKKNFNILVMFAQIVGPRGYTESYWGGKGAYFQFILRQCQGTLRKIKAPGVRLRNCQHKNTKYN